MTVLAVIAAVAVGQFLIAVMVGKFLAGPKRAPRDGLATAAAEKDTERTRPVERANRLAAHGL